jgi:hypothetical protein
MRLVPNEQAELALQKAIAHHWARYGEITVRYDLVELSVIRSVIPLASRRRFTDAVALLERFELFSIPAFAPVVISSAQKGSKILFGPLVERNMDQLVLLDGVHRSLAAWRAGIGEIYAATVSAQSVPPPVGPLYAISQIRLSESGQEPPIFFEGKGLVNFRPSALFISTAEELMASQMRECVPLDSCPVVDC